MSSFLIALDQGTTSCRALLVDQDGEIRGMAQREITQIYPRAGWVEHDAEEIWSTQEAMLRTLIDEHRVEPRQIRALGITNQRETTIVWDRQTGRPVSHAIVWQDKRTAPLCETLAAEGLGESVRRRTGLLLDPYFSATKVHWILEHVEGARQRAQRGELCFGTVDCWLIWKLTGSEVHATDPSNASRTMLYDIRKGHWDEALLERFGIPRSMLPEVRDSAGDFGHWSLAGHPIPIAAVLGDQQSALFGQGCFTAGEAKNTYGTGCFLMLNTGPRPVASDHGLLTTIAWRIAGEVTYALEGSVFIAGAAMQWLRDGLGLLQEARDSEYFAGKLGAEHGVYVVPAFAGLGAPHWDMHARGAIFGLTLESRREHLIRATLESLAYQTLDVLRAMEEDSGLPLQALRVDGGAAANDLLLQFQSDILNVPVERPAALESTALGVAYLAGLQQGVWTRDEILGRRQVTRTFTPEMDSEARQGLVRGWNRAVERSRGWLAP